MSQQMLWWLNMAISYIMPTEGEYTRFITIYDPQQLEYYKPGRVFQWRNFSSAYFGKIDRDQIAPKANVCFRIWGRFCRSLALFKKDQKTPTTALFGLYS